MAEEEGHPRDGHGLWWTPNGNDGIQYGRLDLEGAWRWRGQFGAKVGNVSFNWEGNLFHYVAGGGYRHGNDLFSSSSSSSVFAIRFTIIVGIVVVVVVVVVAAAT
jgi:hypothetical protein